jgi:hypothetical protein
MDKYSGDHTCDSDTTGKKAATNSMGSMAATKSKNLTQRPQGSMRRPQRSDRKISRNKDILCGRCIRLCGLCVKLLTFASLFVAMFFPTV